MESSTNFNGKLLLENGQLAYPTGYFYEAMSDGKRFTANVPFNEIIWFSKNIGIKYKLNTLVSVPPCRARPVPCGIYIEKALVNKLISQLTINFYAKYNSSAKDQTRAVFFGNYGLRSFEKHVGEKLTEAMGDTTDIGTLDFTQLEKQLTEDYENFVFQEADLGNLFITPKPKFNLWTFIKGFFK